MIRLGCDVWLSRPLRPAITFAAREGASIIELICNRDDTGESAHEPIPAALADEARTIAADTGVALEVMASVYNFRLGDPDPAAARRSADAVRSALEFAGAIGASRVGVRTDKDGSLTDSRRRARFAEHAAALGVEADQAGIVLALENLHDPIPLYLSLLALPELAGWGALWNVAHAHAYGGPVAQSQAVRMLARPLVGFALSDNRGQADDHLAIGRGNLDVRGFLDEVWAPRRELPVFLELTRSVELSAGLRTLRRWAAKPDANASS